MIEINSNSCIKCGRCISICPSNLFSWSLGNKENAPIIPDTTTCIVCGHCVAACPVDAIAHANFPKDKIHKIDYSSMPTPAQLRLLIHARRSNRAFSKEAIAEDTLMQIIDAAHRAPTAMNSQNVEFLLIKDKELIKQVSNFTIKTFNGIAKTLNNPVLKFILKPFMPDVYKYVPRFITMKKEFENGNDLILRGAVALLIIHAPKGSRYAREDSNLAYQNASLMAESLSVSQFYTGFVLNAISKNKGTLEKILGLEGRTIGAGMAMGIPQFKLLNYIDKKDIKYTIK